MYQGVIFFLLLLLDVPDVEAQRARTGALTKFATVERTNEVCHTQGGTLTQMPDMVRTFTVGGPTSSSALVLFNGAGWSVVPGQAVRVQLTVDGVPISGLGTGTPVWIYGQSTCSGTEGAHGLVFATDVLVPGPHTARLRWATSAAGGVVGGCIGARSLTVLHK